ncbi:primase-helicase family protein [Enterovibrio norvegicus]|uniref:primase-helicase family protein n=1 Tax=Enterovibrio norvegicus TaxID=188144 RepID=UPI0002D77867|nr:primase-helicase family protein [Enterovibrio norvegicus]OEF53826.1 hypothetical protein A1OU_01655 [Enterovibrio norvegicus]
MIDSVNLALADKAAVYYFHHYKPELCYLALKHCKNPLIIEAISGTLPTNEADCGTWSGDSREAMLKRNDYLVAKLGERRLVEKLVIDSDSAAAFKAAFISAKHENLQTIYPICPSSAETQVNQGITEVQISNNIYPISTPSTPQLCHSLGDGTPLKAEQVQVLAEINERYTHVTIGCKHKVVMKKPCQTHGMAHSFEDLGQFRNYFLHCERIEGQTLGAAWLKWPSKNYKPDGVGFYPLLDRCPDTVFNMFMGYGVVPSEGDISPYLYHLKEVICAGDESSYTYLLSWMAHLVQKPDEKPNVAIVMKSVEGTGKGTMVEPLAKILGPHFIPVNGHGQIVGRFNSTIANKLLVFADEVELTDTRVADKLKGLITEPTINLERKGIDPEPMPNYSRFMFASNRDQVIRAGLRERRYLVLEPDTKHAQDIGYFSKLRAWIHEGGAEALLHHLLSLDITDFSPHKAPATSALLAEKLTSLKPSESYLFAELSREKPFNGAARLTVTELVEDYRTWADENLNYEVRLNSGQTQVGRLMARIGVQVLGRSDRGGGKYYEIDPAKMRTGFAEAMGQQVEDIF